MTGPGLACASITLGRQADIGAPIPLTAERLERHVFVSGATGTGKTVMAAVDYARLRQRLARGRLLFVAHRQELLDQSRATYAQALRDPGFGEYWVAGRRPERWEHVFASIQSLSRNGLDGYKNDVARAVLGGEQGADRDLTVLNAGAAIYVGGGADSLEAGVRGAEQAIDSGAALALMERFVARTRELAG